MHQESSGKLLIMMALILLLANPSWGEEAKRASYGRLKYLDSIFQPSLAYANCARVSADGKYLYVTAWDMNSISVLRRDISTGRLENVQTMQSDRDLNGVTAICLSPNGRLAAATAFRSHSAVLLERDEAAGTLRFLDAARDGEKAVKGLEWAVSGIFSPDSRFLYVCDPKASGVVGSKVGERGALTAFQVTENRKLKWIESNPGRNGCFDGTRSILFHPDRKLACTASTTANAVVMLDWNADTGKLTVRQILSDEMESAGALAGAMELAWSPDGRFLYVSSGRFKGDNGVSVFRLTDTNQLVWIQEFISEQGELRGFAGGNVIRVSPDGRNVYAAGTESHSLACFERDQQTGKLAYLETLMNDRRTNHLQGAAGIAISPDGKHVYVTAEYSGGVSIFERQLTE